MSLLEHLLDHVTHSPHTDEVIGKVAEEAGNTAVELGVDAMLPEPSAKSSPPSENWILTADAPIAFGVGTTFGLIAAVFVILQGITFHWSLLFHGWNILSFFYVWLIMGLGTALPLFVLGKLHFLLVRIRSSKVRNGVAILIALASFGVAVTIPDYIFPKTAAVVAEIIG